jgi:hypothetical protein
VGFWDFDLVNLKGSFTKACAEIFGLPHGAEPGQISYAEWLEAIHPEDRSKAYEATTAQGCHPASVAKKGDCGRRGAVAEDASRSKDHFIATLSRELRTSLNAIVGDCQPSRISVPREHGRLPYSPFGNIFVPFPAIETPIICAKSSRTVW